MPDIDPITREALKRASHMHQSFNRSAPAENTAENKTKPEAKPDEPRPKSSFPVFGGGLDALFKDKETSVILILILLLMGEKGSESLLLALIYLLI